MLDPAENLLVVADLGAAGNLVKNIVLQSPDVDFPYPDRLKTILAQYPDSLRHDKKSWLHFEYRLRQWKKLHGVDLSDDLNWTDYQTHCLVREKPVVFLNHSAFYQVPEFLKFYEKLKTLVVVATDDWQVKWQVRAYVEKKGIEELHDFSFESDKQQQIEQFIRDHGAEEYYRTNIDNMYEIMKQRASEMLTYIDSSHVLPLEWIIVTGDDQRIVDRIEKCFGISIPFDHASIILETWRKLHWPTEETLDWKWWKQ